MQAIARNISERSAEDACLAINLSNASLLTKKTCLPEKIFSISDAEIFSGFPSRQSQFTENIFSAAVPFSVVLTFQKPGQSGTNPAVSPEIAESSRSLPYGS